MCSSTHKEGYVANTFWKTQPKAVFVRIGVVQMLRSPTGLCKRDLDGAVAILLRPTVLFFALGLSKSDLNGEVALLVTLS